MYRRWIFSRDLSGTSSDLDDFRAHTLRVALWMMPGAVLAGLRAYVVDYDHTPVALLLILLLLASTALGGHTLVNRAIQPAALLTLVGSFVSLTLAVLLFPMTSLVMLYSLLVLVAIATLGNRIGFATAGLALAVISAGSGAPRPVLAGETAATAACLVVASAILCWAVTAPLSIALDWAWRSYEDSRQTATHLRHRQAELGRALKSLTETYTYLERLNNELARARRVAEDARHQKSLFAARISHELRTPLNLIIGFSEMVAAMPEAYAGEPLPEPYRRDINTILRNARHLSDLIEDVLDLSRIEANHLALIKEPIVLAEVIDEAIATVSRLITGKGLDLSVRVAPDLPLVLADRIRIRQVLINLLSNAARFTDRGQIVLTAERNGNDLEVRVIDSGIGIAPEDLPRIFEEFRQGDAPGADHRGGWGLGLAVSKQIVELHAGSMWADSQPGAGTALHFTLPLAPSVVPRASQGDWQVWDRLMAGRVDTLPRVDVLVPEERIGKIFERHLEGYHVVVRCSDAPSDTNGNKDDAPAVRLVVSSSWEAAWREVERRQRDSSTVPVAVCALQDGRDAARELGVTDYLLKPVTRAELHRSFQKLASRPRSVLIVDDDHDMLRLLTRWIRTLVPGCQIRVASSGEEALALLREQRPDVLLLDLVMPGHDGFAVLRTIRTDNRCRDLPVIAITAHGPSDDTLTGYLAGIVRSGGLSLSELMRCLQTSLDVLTGQDRRTARGSGAT